MHVTYIVPTLTGGGAETLVRSVVPALAAQGARVSVVSVYDAQLTPQERAALDAPLYEVGRHGVLDAANAFGRTVKLLAQLRPDVVHGHVHTGKYFGRAAALAAGVRVVMYTEHHPRPEAGVLQRFADRRLREGTASVIAFHQRQKREIAERDAIPLDRIAVIPNGIRHGRPPDPEARRAARAALGLGEGTFVVLFAARLAEQKFPELALDAFAALPRSAERDDCLLIAGDGPLSASVGERARGLGDRVRLLGYRRDVDMLYAAADALLMTSRYEAMPLAPIEAMSRMVPVVTAPWSGADEILAHGAIVTGGYDAAELGASLARLRDVPELAHALGRRGRSFAREEYDIRSTAVRLFELYDELVRWVR